MANKTPANSPANSDDTDIEEKVRQMMEPDLPDVSAGNNNNAEAKSPGTAPEIEDMPDALPTKITILDANEEAEKKPEKSEKKSKLKQEPVPQVESATDKLDTSPAKGKALKIAVSDESDGPVPVATDNADPETDDPSEQAEVTDSESKDTELDDEALREDNPETDVTETAGDSFTETDDDLAQAVNDIVSKESDDLLAAEDEKIAEAFIDKKPRSGSRFKHLLALWWGSKKARRIALSIVLLGLVVAATFPASRYFLLNNAGVRSSASIVVLDESSGQPLKNVLVSSQGQSALTDQEGRAILRHLKLGRTSMRIEKRAFAHSERSFVLGWGSNPLGDTSLSPIGSQYVFKVSDLLSGKPLAKVEAASGDASALSNAEGEIRLTMDVDDDVRFEVVLTANDLRPETVRLSANDQQVHKVAMVASRKHVFISKRSGTYDVYKVDVDGKNESLVLAGTGHERNDMILIPHPKKELAALVSTRDNIRNRDGYPLSTLTLIDVANNKTTKVSQSERIQIIDWGGDRIIFVKIVSGTSAANPNRHRLLSYDVGSGHTDELASSNFFNDVMVVGSRIYYAPSSAYSSARANFYRVNADGSDRQTLLNEEVWNVFRSGYDRLTVATGNKWYEYNVATGSTVHLPGEPADLESKIYADNPAHSLSLWVDKRDGKGVLILHGVSTKVDQDPPLRVASGLKKPVRWLNNTTVVYRIGTEQETADYAVSIDGGEPRKIRDVTNTTGLENWYYY